MAGIFTFDPDPPRVASPWSKSASSTPLQNPVQDVASGTAFDFGSLDNLGQVDSSPLITRLEAEPQEGPTEYKLHLLLRQRRAFTYQTTGGRMAGSQRSVSAPNALLTTPERPLTDTPPLNASAMNISRQHRLEQLTTQLLWRLQQSCPHHSASYMSLVKPQISPTPTGGWSQDSVGRVIPGLEETNGALYEIGVADDGTFFGLAEDEMEESLNTLRIMAASLGCLVEVLRMVPVGECGWFEDDAERTGQVLREGKLWVAEAYVKPNRGVERQSDRSEIAKERHKGLFDGQSDTSGYQVSAENTTEQLRISLTGATMSGKSSLLGSLTTAALDNGRGKSRLSLLKHRHEIASGMTSSVTQELVGYREESHTANGDGEIQVINYASTDVSSWVDIHAASVVGRLVLLSDSAGHPRYRRTTVRGLIGWAPHWTFLCIPADNTEDTSGMTGSTPPPEEVFGNPAVDVDLSQAHLDLCLKLQLPLVIIITKLDLASKFGLKNCLTRVLSSLKAAGRRPVLMKDTNATVEESDLLSVPATERAEVKRVVEGVHSGPVETVPIVFTSAVKGNGIHKLHALFHDLPIPRPLPSSVLTHPAVVFDIEDVFTGTKSDSSKNTPSLVLAGILRYGTLKLGDEVILGPYFADISPDDSDGSQTPKERLKIPTSSSFPGALHRATKLLSAGPGVTQEWRGVKIVSVRNLRLPVRSISEGQVATIGIVPKNATQLASSILRVRKGMVLGSPELTAARIFTAEFTRRDVEMLSIRAAVVVYIASIRASAKVIAGAVADSGDPGKTIFSPVKRTHDDGFGFGFEDDSGAEVDTDSGDQQAKMLVTFQFLASREYVEVGSRVLIMPGGGPGLYGGLERGEKGIAGLEGFVGTVMETGP